jgi:hypothetical protein
MEANPVVRIDPPSAPQRRRPDQQDRFDERIRGICGLRSRKEDRHRLVGQQELSDRRPRDRRLRDTDAADRESTGKLTTRPTNGYSAPIASKERSPSGFGGTKVWS